MILFFTNALQYQSIVVLWSTSFITVEKVWPSTHPEVPFSFHIRFHHCSINPCYPVIKNDTAITAWDTQEPLKQTNKKESKGSCSNLPMPQFQEMETVKEHPTGWGCEALYACPVLLPATLAFLLLHRGRLHYSGAFRYEFARTQRFLHM